MKKIELEKINFKKIIINAILIICAIIIALPLIKPKNNKNEIYGTYKYEDCIYEFLQGNLGKLKANSNEYEFYYEINDNVLKIEFYDDIIQDAVYEFSFDEENLKLIGKEGTTGKTYVLEKS